MLRILREVATSLTPSRPRPILPASSGRKEVVIMKRYLVPFLFAAFAIVTAQGQPTISQPNLTLQNSGTSSGLIAVSPVNSQVVWASGRNGTFTVTTDGGNTWRAGVVPGAELLQFRDVQGVSAKVAYLQSIGVSGD